MYLFYDSSIGFNIDTLSSDAVEVDKSQLPVMIRLACSFGECGSLHEVGARKADLASFLSISLAISAFIAGLLKAETIRAIVRAKFKSLPIETHRVKEEGRDDVSIMLNYYRNASVIHVFSGDFSWLDGVNEISKVISKKIGEGKVRLFSNKGRASVESRMSKKLFDDALPFFTFDVDIGLRASMVHLEGGTKYFLLKRKDIVGGEGEVSILKNSRSIQDPADKIFSFLDRYANAPFFIFVCGPSGAGKTELATAILNRYPGVQHIKVGDIFRQLSQVAGMEAPQRADLLKIGMKYLTVFGAKALAEEIARRVDERKRIVVVDGIRPPETLAELKMRYPRNLTIYVNATDEVRAERLRTRDAGCPSILDNSLDKMAEGIASAGNAIVVENDGGDKKEYVSDALYLVKKHVPLL